MNKYDVRRERNRTATQADISSLQNYENITKTLVSDLPQTIDQIGGIIGNQQATDYINKENEAFKKDVADGKLTYKTDDNGNIIYDASGSPIPLSSEEMFNAREAWFSRYAANNPQPNNPWAQNVIKKSHDSSVASWTASIAETSLKKYQEQINTAMNNEIMSYANAETIDADALLGNNGLSVENLSPELQSLYNDAKGISEKPIYSSKLAGQMLGTVIALEKAGNNPEVALMAAKNQYMSGFIKNNFINDSLAAFEENVINGDYTKDEFYSSLDNALNNATKYDFQQELSKTGKENLRKEISNLVEAKWTEEQNRQAVMYNEQVYPQMVSIQESGGWVSTAVFQNLVPEGFNINHLPDETKTALKSFLKEQDNYSIAYAISEDFNNINSDPTLSNEEKIAKKTAAINGIGNEVIKSGVRAMADSWPDFGNYTNLSKSEAVKTFSTILDGAIFPEEISGSSKSSSSGNVGSSQSDSDIMEIVQDSDKLNAYVLLALAGNEPSVSGVVNASITDSLYKYWEGTLTEEELDSFENDDVEYNAFAKWVNKTSSTAIEFLDRAGNIKIDSNGTTVKDFYDAQKKNVIAGNKTAISGFAIDDPENDPVGTFIRKQNYQNIIYKIATCDPSNMDQLRLDIGSIKNTFTEEQWDGIQQLLNSESNINQLLKNNYIDPDVLKDRYSYMLSSTDSNWNTILSNAYIKILPSLMNNPGINAAEIMDKYIKDELSSIRSSAIIEILNLDNGLPMEEGQIDFASFGTGDFDKLGDEYGVKLAQEYYKEPPSTLIKDEMYADFSYLLNSNNGNGDPAFLSTVTQGAKKSDLSDRQIYLYDLASLSGTVQYTPSADDTDDTLNAIENQIIHDFNRMDESDKYIFLKKFGVRREFRKIYNQLADYGLEVVGVASDPRWFIVAGHGTDENGNPVTFEVKPQLDSKGRITDFYERTTGSNASDIEGAKNSWYLGQDLGEAGKEEYSSRIQNLAYANISPIEAKKLRLDQAKELRGEKPGVRDYNFYESNDDYKKRIQGYVDQIWDSFDYLKDYNDNYYSHFGKHLRPVVYVKRDTFEVRLEETA